MLESARATTTRAESVLEIACAGACAPLGFGRENERVSETRPSEKPDPQRSQAGAHHLDQFFVPSSQFSDTSNETLVPNARIADFSKKNANFQMSSTEKSVSFSN